MNILEKINQELQVFNERKKLLIKELQEQFPVMFKELFDKYPNAESISWNQYTPYFNDGDECIFSVHNDNLEVNNQQSWDLDEDSEVYGEFEAIEEDFKTVLQTIPDDFYRDLFGDHVQVTINKNGTIDTEEYDHD